MDLYIRDNIDEFIKELEKIERKQVPYAISRAINDSAVDAQDGIVKTIQMKFNSKKVWWSKNNRRTGIRVIFSKKDYLRASVYTEAYFAKLQEDGGTKAPKRGKNLAIPTAQTPKKFRKSSGAREAMRQPKTFATKKGIFRRKGKKRYPIIPLFTFTPTAHITPRFEFEATAQRVVISKIQINFEKRLKEALATAK